MFRVLVDHFRGHQADGLNSDLIVSAADVDQALQVLLAGNPLFIYFIDFILNLRQAQVRVPDRCVFKHARQVRSNSTN